MDPRDSDDSVVIRLRDVYEKTTTIDTKVDALTFSMATVEKLVTDHEGRLRTVERRVFALPSLAVLLAIGSLVVGIVALSRHDAVPTTPSGGLSAPKVATVSPTTSTSPSSAPASSSVVIVRRPSSTSTSTTAPRSTTSSVPTSSPVTMPAPPASVAQLLARLEHVAPVTVSLSPLTVTPNALP